jgi:hypothetical protein
MEEEVGREELNELKNKVFEVLGLVVPITERLQRMRQSDIVEPLELASHFNFAAMHLSTLVQELLAVAERRYH